MSLPLIIRPEAEADLAEARDWYAGRRERLVDDFELCVEEALERIGRMPTLYREVHKGGIRRSLVRRFPYAVYYRAEDDRVIVIAVMHTHRDPNRWQSRT